MKIILALALLLFSTDAYAQETFKSEKQNFKIVSLVEKLEHAWSLGFLPNGDMLVTERGGQLNLIRAKTYKREPVSGAPTVYAEGQGGLLDVLVHPNFAQNQIIFLSYAARDDQGLKGTEIVRATLNGTKLENSKVIFRADPKTKEGDNHFGSRLLWGPDDKLYVTLGDRFVLRDEAQNPASHLGKIIRVDENGDEAEIITSGNRNVQGIALRPGTKQIWFHEHGARGGDEVNILKAGANYGWPKVTYGVDYSGAVISEKTEGPGFEPPVIHWTPSIAPSGMAFYAGDKFPAWKNNLFVGALAKTHLRRLVLDGDTITHQEVLLEDLGERIRDVRAGPDGYIYLLTDQPEGQLLRLEPL